MLGAARPDLLAVDDVVVALARGERASARRVGAARRLGDAERLQPKFARGDLRQIRCFCAVASRAAAACPSCTSARGSAAPLQPLAWIFSRMAAAAERPRPEPPYFFGDQDRKGSLISSAPTRTPWDRHGARRDHASRRPEISRRACAPPRVSRRDPRQNGCCSTIIHPWARRALPRREAHSTTILPNRRHGFYPHVRVLDAVAAGWNAGAIEQERRHARAGMAALGDAHERKHTCPPAVARRRADHRAAGPRGRRGEGRRAVSADRQCRRGRAGLQGGGGSRARDRQQRASRARQHSARRRTPACRASAAPSSNSSSSITRATRRSPSSRRCAWSRRTRCNVLFGAYQSSCTFTATPVAERYGIPFVVGDSAALEHHRPRLQMGVPRHADRDRLRRRPTCASSTT